MPTPSEPLELPFVITNASFKDFSLRFVGFEFGASELGEVVRVFIAVSNTSFSGGPGGFNGPSLASITFSFALPPGSVVLLQGNTFRTNWVGVTRAVDYDISVFQVKLGPPRTDRQPRFGTSSRQASR